MVNKARVKVVKRDYEDMEHLIKRFSYEFRKSGVMNELWDKEFYQSPSLKKKLKREKHRKLVSKLKRKHEN